MLHLALAYPYKQEETIMGLIQGVVDGFIITVGITPPTPETKRFATIFIATGLFGTILGIAALFTVLVSRIFAH